MYDYPIIAPQIGLMFMLSVIIIHTQYVRRCVNKPDWSKPSEPEPELPAFSERKVISWILLFIPYEVMYWIYRFFVHRKIE
jgi:putative inorganic carbon (hco3(-)) transporter